MSSFAVEFSTSSGGLAGYDVCLTRIRSRVRAPPGVLFSNLTLKICKSEIIIYDGAKKIRLQSSLLCPNESLMHGVPSDRENLLKKNSTE